MRSLCFILLAVFFTLQFRAQRNLAYEMMDSYEYRQAISYFKNVSENDLNDEDLTRLAYCYFTEKDFVNAISVYEKVVKIKYVNPINYKYYGICLKNTGKLDKAKKYLTGYNSIDSTDYFNQLAIASISQLPSLKSKENKNVKVVNISSINSAVAQFSLKNYQQGVLYVGEVKDDLNKKRLHLKLSPDFKDQNQLQYGLTERPLMHLFYAHLDHIDVNNQFAFTHDTTYHIGAFDVDRTNNEIYFTKINLVKGWDVKNVSYPTLYKAKIDFANKTISNSEPLIIEGTDKGFLAGHPAISNDGKYIIFASEMKGGFGGSDLYVIEKKGNSWSAPKNLGAQINTKGDEDFPVIYKDNTLYFSSNGKIGFGGLDIFKTSFNNGVVSSSTILLEPYNSSADDFGFVANNDNENYGYFTSNRFGGSGDDDIYLVKNAIDELLAKGKVLNQDATISPNSTVKLIDENGKEIASIKANEFGKFKFNLDDKKDYKVVAIKPGFAAKESVSTKTGLNVNKELSLNLKPATTAQGIVKNQDGTPAANAFIKVYDENGNLIYETKTDENGFYQLVLEKDKTYNIVAEKGDFMGNAIVKTDKDYDTMSNTDILLKPKTEVFGKIKDQNGKNAAGVEVKLFDENGNLLAVTTTDKDGNYKFALVKDKNYQIVASKGEYEGDENIYTGQNWNPNDPLDITLRLKGRPALGVVTDRITKKGIEGVKAVITDKATNKKTIVFTNAKGEFNANLRPNSNYILVFSKDGYFPKTLEVPTGSKLPEKIDLNLDYNLSLDQSDYDVKAIYYDFGKASITADSKLQLDKLADVMKNNPFSSLEVKAYADCRGSEQTNMRLSIARSKAVKDYLISKGINSSRISTESMGATNFVNNCYKPEMCTEEEHALNRRAEFNINFEKTSSKKPL